MINFSRDRSLWGTYPNPPYAGAQWANTVTLIRPPANQSSWYGISTAMSESFLFVGAPSTCGTGTAIYGLTQTSCQGMAQPQYSPAYAGNNGLGPNGIGLG